MYNPPTEYTLDVHHPHGPAAHAAHDVYCRQISGSETAREEVVVAEYKVQYEPYAVVHLTARNMGPDMAVVVVNVPTALP